MVHKLINNIKRQKTVHTFLKLTLVLVFQASSSSFSGKMRITASDTAQKVRKSCTDPSKFSNVFENIKFEITVELSLKGTQFIFYFHEFYVILNLKKITYLVFSPVTPSSYFFFILNEKERNKMRKMKITKISSRRPRRERTNVF